MGQNKVLIWSTSLVPGGHKEKLFSKMQLLLFYQVHNGQRHVTVSSGLEDADQALCGTDALPRTIQREPQADEMWSIMAACRHDGSHDSSFDYRITRFCNIGKICIQD